MLSYNSIYAHISIYIILIYLYIHTKEKHFCNLNFPASLWTDFVTLCSTIFLSVGPSMPVLFRSRMLPWVTLPSLIISSSVYYVEELLRTIKVEHIHSLLILLFLYLWGLFPTGREVRRPPLYFPFQFLLIFLKLQGLEDQLSILSHCLTMTFAFLDHSLLYGVLKSDK